MSGCAAFDEIHSYRSQVEQGEISCNLPPCCRCTTEPIYFRRHEARHRSFLVLCGQFIRTVLSLITRWKCPGCGKTFTLYPPFAFPHKRYTQHTIMALTQRYVDEDHLSYRAGVLQQGMPVGYHHDDDDQIDERMLAHSTLYRWVTTLGGLTNILRSAQDLILQENPASTICRDLAVLTIAPKKYIKAARQFVLTCCRQIIYTDAVYRTTFHTSIFPYLATLCRWR